MIGTPVRKVNVKIRQFAKHSLAFPKKGLTGVDTDPIVLQFVWTTSGVIFHGKFIAILGISHVVERGIWPPLPLKQVVLCINFRNGW